MSFAPPFAKRTLRRVARAIHRIGGVNLLKHPPPRVPSRDFFSIAMYRGSSPLALEIVSGAPVLAGCDVTDMAAAYVADPFMIQVGNRWYMFFEILPKQGEKGVIGMATSSDGLRWSYGQIVLEESFHLSYPYVFKHNDEYFMVPETHQAGSLRLYKADTFPTRWSLVGNMMDGVELVDPCPFQHAGKWWLLGGWGRPPMRADTLQLYYADSLMGPWRKHLRSPVVSKNPHFARPAGRVIPWNNRLLRFTQDCSPLYGMSVSAFAITELSETRYKEEPATKLLLKGSQLGWNACGMHHIDCHTLQDGTCLACVDGWRWGPIDP